MNIRIYYTLTGISFALAGTVAGLGYYHESHAALITIEPVQACVIARDTSLNATVRAQFARCLDWQDNNAIPLCRGSYNAISITPLATDSRIEVAADNTSLYLEGRSQLTGNVEIRETQRIINAQTAYIYRDNKNNNVSKIELLGNVRYLEPGRLMLARKATIDPRDKSGLVEDVLYRFNAQRANVPLPAWGRASIIQRLANKNYVLQKATYSTCAPTDNAWQIEADEIVFDQTNEHVVAKNAMLRINDWPLLYSPYLSFSTSKARKSGFLMPLYGYTNIGGFDLGLPYYWNIAPNYDAILVPHVYAKRGLMMGATTRYLTHSSRGLLSGNFLPHDRAFSTFIANNRQEYPQLSSLSTNRWQFSLLDSTQFTPNLTMDINVNRVSDDYYFQDFSTNLAIATQNQLLRQGDLTYNINHWRFKGMLQSYQTLHPVNQSVIADVYSRLPQLSALGTYRNLPLNAEFNVLGQLDYFQWPVDNVRQPQGPRYHLNPVLSLPMVKPWGYITPSVELVENYYNINYGDNSYDQRFGSGIYTVNRYNSPQTSTMHLPDRTFNISIPRFEIDSGLIFERNTSLMGQSFTQTLEPRLYYLNVPYQNQTSIPVFDSGYMIFNYSQLFRNNRFSGFDRTGDANQLAYALSTRWLTAETGREKAHFSIGQLRYFKNRQVQLCYLYDDKSCEDSPNSLGYVSPTTAYSPIASHAIFNINTAWSVSADYVYDTDLHATNNGNLNLHYQPAPNHIISLSYTYLVNGDVTRVANYGVENNALHQTTFAYAWPLTDKWSTLGGYSYNISKGYSMMSFFGLQYDNCCWATRIWGGRTFNSISPNTALPQYNNNVYIQVLLKGLGSVASSGAASTVNSYLPGYADLFNR